MQNVKRCIAVEIMNVTLLVSVDFCVDLTCCNYKTNRFSSGSLTKRVELKIDDADRIECCVVSLLQNDCF